MKYKDKYFIFDLDGTLYNFDGESNRGFTSSKFYQKIKQNTTEFINEFIKKGIIPKDETFDTIKEKSNGEFSLYFENEFGFDRYYFFEKIWNLEPKDFIRKNPIIKEIFEKLKGRVFILTAAPRIWAESVLKYLEVYDIVKNNIISGEPDIRKPNPLVFQGIINSVDGNAKDFISIGDQEYSDILPAKKLGMKTIIVGQKSKDADYEIENIDEIIYLLEKLK
ncbi:HAD family hydrolase [Candidatus Woesearchaeota archaeon]|nr:HAD family hydrolase [Candidatus Woesearchaeota archaeon]